MILFFPSGFIVNFCYIQQNNQFINVGVLVVTLNKYSIIARVTFRVKV